MDFGLPSLTVLESDLQFTMCILKSSDTAVPVVVGIAVNDVTATAGLGKYYYTYHVDIIVLPGHIFHIL